MDGRPAAKDTAARTQLADTTSREYDALIRALHTLEESLASPAPGRETAWKQEARRDLANVIGLLQAHCASAEQEGGLLAEVELQLGRTYALTEARLEHERLLRDAVTLLGALDQYQHEETLSHHEVRRRAWDLARALRSHQAREADLLVEALQRDVGVVD